MRPVLLITVIIGIIASVLFANEVFWWPANLYIAAFGVCVLVLLGFVADYEDTN